MFAVVKMPCAGVSMKISNGVQAWPGVLQSQRGVKGGYSFARPPGEITVLQVVELLDGALGADAAGIFADAATAARDVLAGATIADLVEREAREAGSSMYYI